jgi:dCTP deaminase
MILTGMQIQEEVRSDRIVITPFNKRSINPNSYNYHLGNTIKIAPLKIIDKRESQSWESVALGKGKPFLLEPQRLYLGHTHEVIGSKHYVTSLIGKSSMGRLGLYLQVSADLGHQGAIHRWTLELCVVQPLFIYAEMPIGQVSFWKPWGRASTYQGRYGMTNHPLENQDNN